jgi:hypothetical protein
MLEALGELKNPISSSEFEPATFCRSSIGCTIGRRGEGRMSAVEVSSGEQVDVWGGKYVGRGGHDVLIAILRTS